MGGISAGVGLASGLDTGSLIQQLLQIEARPQILAQQRVLELQQEQAAWLGINTSLSSLQSASEAFRRNNLFEQFRATSTNDSILTATASSTASTGTYTFFVERLVGTQQSLSRGFSDTGVTGLGADSFTFESALAELRTSTRLGELNGGDGVERGVVRITDKAGNSADIDLSRAVDIDDVLDAINQNQTIGVTASATGDGLVITDTTGAGGNLVIENGFGDSTATSLGIEGSSAGTTITGAALRTLSGSTTLSQLNDGLGVEIRDGLLNPDPDFTITARDGSTLDIDLGRLTEEVEEDGETVTNTLQNRASSLQDVIDIINQTATDAGVNISAGLSGDGKSLVINDTTGGGGNLIVESTGTRHTAEDLGIATGGAGIASSTLTGDRLLSGLNSVLTRTLNGGAGLGNGEFTLTDRLGNSTTVTLSAGALNGSLSEVIDELNAGLSGAGVGITVGYNDTGSGLKVTDTSGGSGNLTIAGEGATNAGLETAGVLANEFQGASAQRQYIGANTLLSDLNNGNGIGAGEFSITDAAGNQADVTLGSSVQTVGDLLSFLNSRPNIQITASLNATGDGIQITDDSGGGGSLTIEDLSGDVAGSLNIDGTFTDEGSGIVADGSYETVVEFDLDDTLDDILQKVNNSGVGVVATIVNDGAPNNPYRLSFTARESGDVGRVLIGTGNLDLGLDTLAQGQDAVVFYGAGDPKDGVLLTSTTNSLSDAIRGVTIDLNGTSSERVDITIDPDTTQLTAGIEQFVEAFNAAIGQIDTQSVYNVEAERGGPLVGDGTARRVRRELINTLQSPIEGIDNRYRYLFEIGIRLSGSSSGNGNQVEFDRTKFEEALAEDPEAVQRLFEAFAIEPREDIEIAPGITTRNTGPDTYSELGVMEQIALLIDGFTDSIDGVITRQTNNLDTRIGLQEDRIEAFDEQLARKRDSLTREFANLELVIAGLQNQQQALGSIQSIGSIG